MVLVGVDYSSGRLGRYRKARDYLRVRQGSLDMPLYYFNLQTNTGVIRDPDGTELPDEVAAREHAAAVARELVRNRQIGVRSWRLDMCDASHQLQTSLILAEFDEGLASLSSPFRETVMDGCVQSASLRDAIRDLNKTLLQIKGTIARSKQQPYLAAIEGVQI
jgi:hypothetical protein